MLADKTSNILHFETILLFTFSESPFSIGFSSIQNFRPKKSILNSLVDILKSIKLILSKNFS